MDTAEPGYATRLVREQNRWWKKLLLVQAPYVVNLRLQRLGRTLDVGCGIGRNLRHLPPGSLGVDHNTQAVQTARRSGLHAMTVEEFKRSRQSATSFDSLLVAHVLEHMTRDEARALLAFYMGYLRPGGSAFIVCPQERGFASDATHVWFADASAIRELVSDLGMTPIKNYSFPFPRWCGRFFKYNEFCVRAQA